MSTTNDADTSTSSELVKWVAKHLAIPREFATKMTSVGAQSKISTFSMRLRPGLETWTLVRSSADKWTSSRRNGMTGRSPRTSRSSCPPSARLAKNFAPLLVIALEECLESAMLTSRIAIALMRLSLPSNMVFVPWIRFVSWIAKDEDLLGEIAKVKRAGIAFVSAAMMWKSKMTIQTLKVMKITKYRFEIFSLVLLSAATTKPGDTDSEYGDFDA